MLLPLPPTPAGSRWSVAVDTPAGIATSAPNTIGIHLTDVDDAVRRIVTYARDHPIGAILAIDDKGALIAAQASAALGLPHNDPAAALAARDKYVMREALAAGGVPVPAFRAFRLTADPDVVAPQVRVPLRGQAARCSPAAAA